MKTAPFNLEKALAGHPLVTVDGLPVTNFRLRGTYATHSSFPFAASIADREELFTREGRFKDYESDHRDLCLLLEPEPQINEPALSPKEQAVIAAAPELLEALEALVKVNEEHNSAVESIIGRPIGWKDSYLDAARAAIAKAKGSEA